jgi:hypothetical protein
MENDETTGKDQTYQTMTPKGMYGSAYQGNNIEEVLARAAKDGYQILDITDGRDGYGNPIVILVIPDDDYEYEED